MAVFAPAFALSGIATFIQPRIFLAAKRDSSEPALYKILNYVILFAGMGIGFYLRYTFFQDAKN